VTSVGPYAFASCSSLTCVIIAGSPTVDSTAFYSTPSNRC
jgi:hypothetical protein